MTYPEGSAGDKTDFAALAAGAVAVSVSLFVAEGAWNVAAVAISATLVTVILAYVWRHSRSVPKSLAVAMSIALASLPASGFFWEMFLAKSEHRMALFFENYGCFGAEDSAGKKILVDCNDKGQAKSSVNAVHLTAAWLLVTLVAFCADRYAEERRY